MAAASDKDESPPLFMIPNPAESKSFLNFRTFVRLVIYLMVLHLVGDAMGQKVGPMGHNRPLPDPRFRTVIGLNELQNIVHLLAAKNGMHVRVAVVEDLTGTVSHARVSGVALSARIEVNPQLARILPPNTWAFILGHELAHLVDPRAQNGPGRDLRTIEWNADVIGAGYAIRAGFDFAAHLGWVLSRPNYGSPQHGTDHERAMNIARHYPFDWAAVRACQNRYCPPAPRYTWR